MDLKTHPPIAVADEAVAAFCQRHHIRRLAFFGSVLREDFGPDSDVDVLVEFERGHAPGFFGLARMEREFSALVGGRVVDLRTPAELGHHFRDDVLRSAVVAYASRSR